MQLRERRKEQRHVVVGIAAEVNGQPWTIVDISRSAVRLLKPQGYTAAPTHHVIGFTTDEAPNNKITVAAEIVRSTPLEIVFQYKPPFHGWNALIRKHDTFLLTKLDAIDVEDSLWNE